MERSALQEVWRTEDPRAKLRLYAGFVHGVHDRLAALFALLIHAGPEVAQVLAVSEEERLTGVTATGPARPGRRRRRREGDPPLDRCSGYGTTVTGQRPARTRRTATEPMKR